MVRRHDRSQRGFTIVELLVVLVVIGVITAIAVPTLMNSLDRGRQMRTMADLRTIGGAVEAYGLDYSTYPATTDQSELATMLQSEYTKKLAGGDGWNQPWVVNVGPTSYTLGSTGKHGSGPLTLIGAGGMTHGFDADIIFSNGAFAQWPSGVQQD